MPAAEWIAGLVPLPAPITDQGGDPHQPRLVVFACPEARVPVLHVGMLDSNEPPSRIVDHFDTARRNAKAKRMPPPAVVRTSSRELADALRHDIGELTRIVCAPTPEIDLLADALSAFLEDADPPASFSYLLPGISKEEMASFFATAAHLYRLQPWKAVPDDSSLLRVNIESLGVRDAALSVMGQLEQSFGWILFPSMHAFEQFAALGEALDRGDEPPDAPDHMALSFERASEMPAAMGNEVKAHRWPLANRNAYPVVMVADEDAASRPPTARELTIAKCVSAALAELLEKEPRPRVTDAWRAGAALESLSRVPAASGPIEVKLSAPFEPEPAPCVAPLGQDGFNIYEEKPKPDGDGGMDEGWFERYRQQLLDRFASSPEFEKLEESGYADIFMQYAAGYYGITVARTTPSHVRELVFETFPRKVSMDPSQAGAAVAELRAFWKFLGRAFGLANAEACARVLEGDAAARLERELANPANFGMAKSFFMGGQASGFDMETEEGLQAAVAAYNGALPAGPGPFAMNSRISARPRLTGDEKRVLRNRRKAERRARRHGG